MAACRPGPAVFWLTHETLGVPPLYSYEFEVLPAAPVMNMNTAPTFDSSTATREVAENSAANTPVGLVVTADDTENDTLTYAIPGPSFFTIDGASGQIRVAPGALLNHEVAPSHIVTVTAADPSGLSATIAVTITVTDVNEAPVAGDEVGADAVTTDEDTPMTIFVLANDTDPETDPLRVTGIATQPRDGIAAVDAGRLTVTYTPAPNHHGAADFTYTVSDGTLTDTGSVAVVIRAVNDAPDFGTAGVTRSVSEAATSGADAGARVVATDPDHAALTYGLSLNGSSDFAIHPDTGQITVAVAKLDREDTASYSGTVTAIDAAGASGDVPITITVTDVDEAPVAGPDNVTTNEDTPISINVLENDHDPEGLPLRTSLGADRPRNGTASVDRDGAILYTPNRDFHGGDGFTYTVSDGRLTATGLVSVQVDAVNDWPAFAAATATFAVSESAQPGDKVGQPVAVTDRDDDTLTYSLDGTDHEAFDIGVKSGQVILASGTRLISAVQSSYEVIITASDGNGGSASVEVTINVTAGPAGPPIITGGAGGGGGGGGAGGGGGGGAGGGGGGGGPSPSVVDFEWTVTRDIDELDSGHEAPTGAWSDGTLLWIAENGDGADDAVYAYDLVTGERVEAREFELDESNRAPRGLWSNGKTAWVADSGQDRLFAYDLESGERDEEREIELAERNGDPRGIWSDGDTIWVDDGLFAYDLATGELIAEYALDSANDDPQGLWSDGVTVWVSDHGAKRLFAYRLPVREEEAESAEVEAAQSGVVALERVRDEEFTELSRAGNNSPRGIWSDGEVMYVVDASDGRVYSYNLPDAIDARLASLSLSGVDIGEFSPSHEEYEGAAGEGVTETTVTAEAMQRRTVVVIDPPDADGDDANGHQVALQDLGEITVTVTSADGSRTKTYRVRLAPEEAAEPAPEEAAEAAPEEAAGPVAGCLRGDIAVGFSLVVSAGGSIEDLVACAEGRNVAARYTLDSGAFVSYILGAPVFVNKDFRALFAAGVPALTPLIARSDGPASPDPSGDEPRTGDATQLWPACVQGEIVVGFSLVIYEGGSVDDLAACARSLDITALYTLNDGAFVSHIVGAPEFVNRSFAGLFPDGLPVATPLVVKRD